jgi:hypothetical protein
MYSIVRSRSARIVVVGLVLMTLLAMSLPALQFERGAGLLLPFAPTPQGGVGSLTERADWFLWLFRGLLALAIVLLPLYIVINLFSPEGRRRLLADLIMFAVIWAVASYLADHPLVPGEPLAETQQQAEEEPPPDSTEGAQPLPAFNEQIEPWMMTAAAAGLAAAGALAAYVIARRWPRREPARDDALESLAEEAQTALAALSAGDALENVIVACYVRMSQVLRDARGIERSRTMTPAEFQAELVRRGLPANPVADLTRLFEQVRYGRQTVGEAEQKRATESLAAVVEYCRGRA